MITDMATSLSKPKSLLYLQSVDTDDSITRGIIDRGWTVDLARCPEEALDLMGRKKYSVGLMHCDGPNLNLDKIEEQAEELNSANAQANWVALLSNVNIQHDAMAPIIARYFYAYHTLPFETDRLLVTLGHAHGMAAVANGIIDQANLAPSVQGLLGESPQMKSLMKQVMRVSNTDFNVLIRGESGTGKELAAKGVHCLSKRAAGPFVPVNCGALPRDLIQSELFGHEKGAFSGADRSHTGRIESAQNGTLFLDEIGDLPLELQTNLLRFLQEKSIERVGGSGQIFLDVRVVAATNVNLEEAVKKGHFREDLYYRLNVLNIDAPPLRERGSDIRLLAESFFEQFSKEANPNLKGLSKQAINAMEAHYWPGNIREMINRMQRAVVMCDGKLITIRDLGLDEAAPSDLCSLNEARAMAEKDIIETTLFHMRNNVSKTARQLDISRVTLYRLMEQHAIEWQGNGN
jgi:DNA-binding NtrC family response regulator